MSSITKQLLRKRAEHNEMMLTNLEEIALHQQEIIKIEGLDAHCRHLKILLLQNNIIEKMENLYKLKELEYLNLALNSITIIEGIEQCESLVKLDLTVNFVSLANLEASVQCLKKCRLKELYLTGNPCSDWAGYRDYVIAQVETLHSLDGKDIMKSERIKAIQSLPQLKETLVFAIEEEQIKQERKTHEEQIKQSLGQVDDKVAYTPETRKEMYLTMAKEKEEKERRQNPEQYVVKEQTSIYLKDGNVRQCDEGGYKPMLNQWDDPEFVVFSIKIPKHLDTSLIEPNIYPTFISVRIKGKLTQLRLEEEVIASKSTIQRSDITGELVIKMPKLYPNPQLMQMKQRKEKEEQLRIKNEQQQSELTKKQNQQNVELMIQRSQGKQSILDQEQYDDMPDLE